MLSKPGVATSAASPKRDFVSQQKAEAASSMTMSTFRYDTRQPALHRNTLHSPTYDYIHMPISRCHQQNYSTSGIEIRALETLSCDKHYFNNTLLGVNANANLRQRKATLKIRQEMEDQEEAACLCIYGMVYGIQI
jgi:hypothetical protein